MFLDNEKKFSFSIKIGKSDITIPFETFLAIAGGIFIISFVKLARTL
jgi:hypothetical protein